MALALARQNRVMLVNRRDEFARAKEGNLTQLNDAIERGRIRVFYNSSMARIDTVENGDSRMLATYHRFWPSHYRVTEAYRERKPAAAEMTLWAAGQVYAARHLLEGVRSERFMATPFWPELAYFDCHACHTPMNANKWLPRQASDLRPGSVRLNDSALLMVAAWLEATDPAAAQRWRDAVRNLHASSQLGADPVRKSSAQLLKLLDKLPVDGKSRNPNWSRMLVRLKNDALEARFGDYVTVEQVLMVIALLEQSHRGEPAFDELYRSLADQHRFHPEAFRKALRDYENGYEQ